MNVRYNTTRMIRAVAGDGLVVVNTVGQVALFVPGGQGVGTLMMGFADIGETAFDINDRGWVNGLSNGAVRWTTGKLGGKLLPDHLIGSKIYKTGYEGGVEVMTEMTENAAVDYLNSFQKEK